MNLTEQILSLQKQSYTSCLVLLDHFAKHHPYVWFGLSRKKNLSICTVVLFFLIH